MTKKTLLLRFCAAAMGTLLALLLVEAGFRAAGGLLLIRREIGNRRAMSADGTYRILCLGESTTQGQWPPFLQEELSGANAGLKFKVIDKGRRGTFSAIILSHIDEYMDAFRPQMVVVMMGINDGQWVWKNALEYEDKPSVKMLLWLKEWRINKLLTYIVDGLRNRGKESPSVPYRPVDIIEAKSTAAPSTPVELGRWHRERGEYKKAEELFNEALRANPGDAQPYIELGNLRRERGDYKKAEELLVAAREHAPGSVRAHIELGSLYREMGSYNKSREVYEEAIKANPDDPNAYIGLGNLYFVSGERRKAEEAFQAGMNADRKNSWIYIHLGDLYHQNGEYDEAERIYAAAIENDPTNSWVYFQLKKLFEDKFMADRKTDPANFERLYALGINAAPGNPWPYLGLADLHRKTGYHENAERFLRRAMRADPKDPQAYIDLGDLYEHLKSFKDAESAYRAGIKIAPKQQNLYVLLGNLYRRMGEASKAEQVYKAAIKEIPADPRLYLELGHLYYYEMGEKNKVDGLYETAIGANPKSPWIYLELAKIHAGRGEAEKAAEVLARGRSALGDIPEMNGIFSVLPGAALEGGTGPQRGRMSYPPLGAIRNYQKLRDRVLARGAKLVCVQYPMRDVEVLKETLGTDKGILYVENKKDFEEALRTRRLTEVFVDMFGGDFGHCTDFGNKLIARNISKAVLTSLSNDKH